MQTCLNCSATLDADSAFCTSCGTPIVQTIHCPKCGGIINADAKFCKFCAFDLSQPIQRAATATSPLPPLSTINPQTQNLPPQVEPIPPFQGNPKSTQTEIGVDNPASFISPSGAAFVVICFFLPWLEWSACGIKKTVSGAELANYDGSFFLYPLAGIVSILAYFIFKGQKKTWKSRPFIIISSGLALFLLFYKYNSIPSSPEFMGQRISASDLGFEARIGSFGTVLGFVLAIVGCAFMSRKIAIASSLPNPQQSSVVLPNEIKLANVSGKQKLSVISCYIIPPLAPFLLFLILGVFGFNPSVGVGFFLLLAATFLLQLFFFWTDKTGAFVKFHALQSVFYFAAYFIVSFLGLNLIGAFFGKTAPFLETTRAIFFPINTRPQFLIPLMFLQWVVPIFLAVKAGKGKIYKFPVIGNWAASKALENNQSFESAPPNQPSYTPSYVTGNYTQPTVESPNFTPPSPTQSAETFAQDLPQSETTSSKFSESSQTSAKDQRVMYIVGGSILGLFLIGVIVLVTSSRGDYASNTNTNASFSNTTSSSANRSSSNMNSAYVSNSSGNMNSSSTERIGRLTTNLNLRSAPNRTALSVGIHFQNARVRILDEESYDTEDGYSTWYKVKVTEYGCDSQGNLGCGKNSDNDSDEGWLNSKYVVLD